MPSRTKLRLTMVVSELQMRREIHQGFGHDAATVGSWSCSLEGLLQPCANEPRVQRALTNQRLPRTQSSADFQGRCGYGAFGAAACET